MTKVIVGGVPEHFNLPWILALERNTFREQGIDLEWVNVPGGTGAMCEMLRQGKIDMAVALTEGMSRDILLGNPSKIVQFYVRSPLRWGVFVSSASKITHLEEGKRYKFAISRYGSGSHLMAYINAQNHGIQIQPSDFVLVNDLSGARRALRDDLAQIFLWEKYTTKPLVDSQEFRMIGECPTPWPCFVISATNQFINTQTATLNTVLQIINESCRQLLTNEKSPALIAERYSLKIEDALSWFNELEYECTHVIQEEDIRQNLWRMQKLGIVENTFELSELIFMPHLEPAGSFLPECI